MGTGSFPGVKCGRGVLLTTHPLLALRSWKRRAITLPPVWATKAGQNPPRVVAPIEKEEEGISNVMQFYTVYLYLETAPHVSGCTSTNQQERIQLYLQAHTLPSVPIYRFFLWRCDPTRVMSSSFMRFPDHT